MTTAAASQLTIVGVLVTKRVDGPARESVIRGPRRTEIPVSKRTERSRIRVREFNWDSRRTPGTGSDCLNSLTPPLQKEKTQMPETPKAANVIRLLREAGAQPHAITSGQAQA